MAGHKITEREKVTVNSDASVVITQETTEGGVQKERLKRASLASLLAALSVYTQTETDTLINTKQDKLISGTSIKSLNGKTLLGGGNINIEAGLLKSVEGTDFCEIVDGAEGAARATKIVGRVEAAFDATTYAEYHGTFAPTTNPTVITKDSENQVISTAAFSNVELLDISLVQGDGTVSQRFTDRIDIDDSGTAVLHKETGKITAQQIVSGWGKHTDSFYLNNSGFSIILTKGNPAFEQYQLLYPNTSNATSRSAVLCNWVNNIQNGVYGHIYIDSAQRVRIDVDSSIYPETVVDTDTAKAWFAASDFVMYLPLETPTNETLSGTYSVLLDEGYTKIICDDADIAIDYNASLDIVFSDIIKRITDNTHIANMQYHTASIISRMCCVGDSLSVGWGLKDNSGTDASISRENLNICWGKQYERLTGTNVQIVGGSGMQATQFWQNMFVVDGVGVTDFAGKINSMEEDEVYIIGLGMNYDTETVGTTSDIGLTAAGCNKATFYGAYAAIILTILERTPTAKVFCLTIPEAGHSAVNGNIRDICGEVDGAVLLDLENDYADIICREEIMANKTELRNIHFYPAGYSLIAQSMEYIISDYINKHANEFKYFGIA